MNRIVVGGGCFWCVEAILQRLKGVNIVESGYTAGKNKNPTYQQVCTGNTGHAEVVRIHYDSNIINLHTLLYIFMHIHNPTTLNQQGEDKGTQYRSIITYEKGNESQLETIRKVFSEVTSQGKYQGYPNKIVTEVAELGEFFKAEEYHQNYFNDHNNQGYCNAVIRPKVGKFKQYFQKYVDPAKL